MSEPDPERREQLLREAGLGDALPLCRHRDSYSDLLSR
jgi:hypothetical protein